jgi:hypothetical protein
LPKKELEREVPKEEEEKNRLQKQQTNNSTTIHNNPNLITHGQKSVGRSEESSNALLVCTSS